MEDKGLLMIIEGMLDRFDKLVANNATAGKIGAVFEIYNRGSGGFAALNGELV